MKIHFRIKKKACNQLSTIINQQNSRYMAYTNTNIHFNFLKLYYFCQYLSVIKYFYIKKAKSRTRQDIKTFHSAFSVATIE